jgi:hypothetical protein
MKQAVRGSRHAATGALVALRRSMCALIPPSAHASTRSLPAICPSLRALPQSRLLRKCWLNRWLVGCGHRPSSGEPLTPPNEMIEDEGCTTILVLSCEWNSRALLSLHLCSPGLVQWRGSPPSFPEPCFILLAKTFCSNTIEFVVQCGPRKVIMAQGEQSHAGMGARLSPQFQQLFDRLRDRTHHGETFELTLSNIKLAEAIAWHLQRHPGLPFAHPQVSIEPDAIEACVETRLGEVSFAVSARMDVMVHNGDTARSSGATAGRQGGSAWVHPLLRGGSASAEPCCSRGGPAR